jgi:putative Ca2+/H+ antiporter (TMEM165/GDT1 family)
MCPGVYFGRFVRIFAMMAAGEFGDKTQLVTIGLAATYGATPAIWAGEMLAIIPVSLANAYFFHTFADRFDAKKAHLFSAGLFAFFALDTVLGIVTRLAYGPGGSVTVWETVVEFFADVVLAVV